jgi:YVTN family beta-propeller protein
MLADIPLDGPGEDWALGPDGKRLFVTLPDARQVAVIDTDRWRAAAEIEAGRRPTRAVLQADGRYLWVGDDATGPGAGALAIDTSSLEVSIASRPAPGRTR